MVMKRENRSQWLWTRSLTQSEFRQYRARHGWSASQYGAELAHAIGRPKNYSRSTIKHIEGGSKPASPNILHAFNKLRQVKGEGKKTDALKPDRTVLSRYSIPGLVRLIARPRLCRGHRMPTIFRTPTQVYCGYNQKERDECRKLWISRRHRAAARRRKTHNARRRRSPKRTGGAQLRRKRAAPPIT